MSPVHLFFAVRGLFKAPGLLFVLAILVSLRLLAADDFIAGADVSHLDFFAARGIVYKSGGTAQNALALLKEQGLNCVRLRLFTSSASQAQADPYNSINNLDYTLPLAVRAKAAGLRLLLDFHYSDAWADPGHQAKPAAWAHLSFPQLEQQMYDYNSNSIAAFKAAGAMPDFVQVGNEITSGLLWPEGRVGGAYDNQWPQLGRLLAAAIRGIKDASGQAMPKIMIHIDRGGDWAATQWYFDHVIQQQVSFDMIGESYYPFWDKDLDALRTCLNNAAGRYHKPVVVAETAFPWANSTNIFGIPASPDGQVQYLAALAGIVRGVPARLGAGIVWWGAEYQHLPGFNLAGFETRSFFDDGGSVLPIASAFGQLTAPVVLQAAIAPGGAILKWPLSGAGMLLTTSENLVSSGTWPMAGSPIQSSNGVFQSTVPINETRSRFYRLESKP